MTEVLGIAEILVTTLHLLAVNAAVGGTALALWLHLQPRDGEAFVRFGPRLLHVACVGLYVGTIPGFAAVWLWWLDAPTELERAAAILPESRYYFAAAELVFSAACFEAWRHWWSRRRRTAWLIGIAGFTNLAYHFPTMFAVLSVYAGRPWRFDQPPSYLTLLNDAEVLARVVHFLLASISVGGALLYALPETVVGEARREPNVRLRRRGAQIALAATLAQWPIGVALLVALPEVVRGALLGNDARLTVLFVVSLAAVVVLMHRLAAASFGEPAPRQVRSALVWLGVTVVLMTAVRHHVRATSRPTAMFAACGSRASSAAAPVAPVNLRPTFVRFACR